MALCNHTLPEVLHLEGREKEKKSSRVNHVETATDIRHCLRGCNLSDGTCPSACLGESAASL